MNNQEKSRAAYESMNEQLDMNMRNTHPEKEPPPFPWPHYPVLLKIAIIALMAKYSDENLDAMFDIADSYFNHDMYQFDLEKAEKVKDIVKVVEMFGGYEE
jgi:hypothetical protein